MTLYIAQSHAEYGDFLLLFCVIFLKRVDYSERLKAHTHHARPACSPPAARGLAMPVAPVPPESHCAVCARARARGAPPSACAVSRRALPAPDTDRGEADSRRD